MSFDIKVNNETVHTVDVDPRLVTGIRLHNSQGEAGLGSSPFSGVGNDWVNLTLDIQQPTALPVMEDDARKEAEETAKDKEVLVPNAVAVAAEAETELTSEGAAATPEEENNTKPKATTAKKA